MWAKLKEGTMNLSRDIRPLGILGSIVLFIIPATIMYCAHFLFVPYYVTSTGAPYLVGYLIAWSSTMALFFVAALVSYGLEGNAFRWKSLSTRFRLAKMSGVDWLWTLGLFVISMVLYFGLGFTSQILARIPLLAPHPLVPPDFGGGGASARIPGVLMGMPLAGETWVAVVFFVGWLLNVIGEEFWFRGYILPRQELAMGARAWIANGLMFGFNHIWQPWNLLLIVPGALIGAYVVQRRRNTWILIIMHGLMNLILVAAVFLNVAGIDV
jgi:membrane protease YdiL (CAAX protease family)